MDLARRRPEQKSTVSPLRRHCASSACSGASITTWYTTSVCASFELGTLAARTARSTRRRTGGRKLAAQLRGDRHARRAARSRSGLPAQGGPRRRRGVGRSDAAARALQRVRVGAVRASPADERAGYLVVAPRCGAPRQHRRAAHPRARARWRASRATRSTTRSSWSACAASRSRSTAPTGAAVASIGVQRRRDHPPANVTDHRRAAAARRDRRVAAPRPSPAGPGSSARDAFQMHLP